RIWWDLLKDMPSGFDGEIGWELDATSTAGFIAAVKAEEEKKINEQTIQEVHKSPSDFVSDGFHYYKDVVVDTRTGLMWARNANIAGKKMDWSDATKWVEGGVFSGRLDYAGYRDWRLPTQEELALLAERGGSRPSDWLNANGFNNVQADWYWSGTENGSYGGRGFEGVAMAFDMTSGNAYRDGKSNYDYVWPVRSATEQGKIAGESLEKNRLAKEEAVKELPAGDMSDKEKQAALELEQTTVGEMVSVPAGCFTPGGKQVCLDAFRIGKYEVTQRQWLQLMDSRSYFKSCGDDCPVENISWNMIQEFLQKLNSETGKRYRLPTEAEWHYACTSGGKSEDYCGGNNVDALAWWRKNSGRHPHSVGVKQPNGLGIYDMSGNVWEWVSDWYGDTYPTGSRNPSNASIGDRKVVRGGSWLADSEELRADYRYAIDPNVWTSDIGFRLAENTAPGQVSALPEMKKEDQKKVFSLRDKVVVDHLTGLMWTRNGKLAPEKLSFGNAKSLIEKLNKENYAGFSNWRLPNVPEFRMLYSAAKIMAGESRKPLDVFREIFIDYQVWHYWTSYVLPVGPQAGDRVVAFDLEDGTVKYFPKDELQYVLAVR
ncbi:MAG: DUF1566 domain-containing protein, partial [Leptolinea sp.]